MASIPPEIEAVLRDNQVPSKTKTFLYGLPSIDPYQLPSRSRLPVTTALTEINDELAHLASSAKPLIGSERTRLVSSTLAKEAKQWETALKGAFVLKPSPFDGLLQKHVLIGSGSYQREVAKSKEVFEGLIEEIDDGEMGMDMSEGGREKVRDILLRTIKVVETIETSVRTPELRKVRNKTVNELIDGEVHKLVREWNRAWNDDWSVWYRYWCL